MRHRVIRQAGGTLIAVGLAVEALPEDGTALRVGEGAIEAGTVAGGYGRLQVGPWAALHEVQLLALLQGEGGVRVEEGEPVAAGLQIGLAVATVPVLVAAATGKKKNINLRQNESPAMFEKRNESCYFQYGCP